MDVTSLCFPLIIYSVTIAVVVKTAHLRTTITQKPMLAYFAYSISNQSDFNDNRDENDMLKGDSPNVATL